MASGNTRAKKTDIWRICWATTARRGVRKRSQLPPSLAEHMLLRKNHKCPPGHKQTDRRSRWPSPMICPNRLRVLAVSGSQIPGANMSGDWSTFNLNDLHAAAAAAAAASHGGNSDASITLHSLLKLNPRGIKEPNQLGAAAKKQKSPPPSLPHCYLFLPLTSSLSVCSPKRKKTKGA